MNSFTSIIPYTQIIGTNLIFSSPIFYIFYFFFGGTLCRVFAHIHLQMVQVETIMTGIVDNWSALGRTWWTRLLASCVVCFVGMLIGIPMVTQVFTASTRKTSFFPHARLNTHTYHTLGPKKPVASPTNRSLWSCVPSPSMRVCRLSFVVVLFFSLVTLL